MTPMLAQDLPRLATAHYELTKTGIVFHKSMTLDVYESIIRRVAIVSTAVQWQIGDWLVAATGRYEDISIAFALAHKVTGRSPETLRAYHKVSLVYGHDDRGLMPWSFYREALRLSGGDRLHCLGAAANNGWTCLEFIQFINTRLGVDGSIAITVDLDIEGQRHLRGGGRGHRGPIRVI